MNEEEEIEKIVEKFGIGDFLVKEVERSKKEQDAIINLLEKGKRKEEIATELGIRIEYVDRVIEKKEKGLYYSEEEKKNLRYYLQCLSILLELTEQLYDQLRYSNAYPYIKKLESEIAFFKKHIAPKVGL